ncbi:cytochrome c [Alteromonas sp. ASW11-36]|uniref:Cytochrome c n=1 Tax=Alteromonas arenosi TaxID=3055817 RepID=A0ABT7SUH1_9ALTE|nr:cytochrome c [Alteromonas sp. ASW11-36]MDM7859842.1 cytochrome c [Alteromonas sp. ASW11-36]
MKKLTLLAAAASIAIGSIAFIGSATAEEAKSERQAANATQFRQALFQLIRSNMGPLGGMARGDIPMNADVIATNAVRLEQLGMMIPDYMATDTTGFGVDTEALPKIWENMDDFTAKANDLVEASRALQAVVLAGDDSLYRGAIGDVGKTCKACHDAYKAE